VLSFNILIAVALGYVALLFLVAFAAERSAAQGHGSWLRSPWIYTLSLSIYCTAWTFYGAVGYAARSGLEFLTIYLGPTLVMIGWWLILRKLVRIGRAQRITSIADLISSRFGKSNMLGVIVTLLAVIGTTPYIALQLQSVTLSFAVFADEGSGWSSDDLNATALWIAVGLAAFTVLFGTRNLDANERHHGVVMAIALEAVVKLFALLAVGVFVVWQVAGGPAEMMARINVSDIANWQVDRSRWIGLTFLSAAAFLCLPRMFQVLVVENADERHVATASWAFPLYLALMSLFVVPIAVVGLDLMPEGSNPDLFVLTLPLSQGANGLAMLSFLGGFSSATSMVIVAAIALSTMVSNHIVMPIWLSRRTQGATMSGDVRRVVIRARRLSIGAVLALGWFYYRMSGGGTALAAIGLISFCGVAQVLPALLGGIFWRGATRIGAAAGLLLGFAIWAYTLFLPSFGAGAIMSHALLDAGPFGINWLRPQALFGIEGLDSVVHAVLWSMMLNTLAFVTLSVLTFPSPIERLQGAQIVNIYEHSSSPRGWSRGIPAAEDLLTMAQRILGAPQAQALFQAEVSTQGKANHLPEITPDFLARLERELAGSVGAATAHAMIGQIVGGTSVTVEDLIAVADETAQIMEYSSQLEAQSHEVARTARQLRDANEKLTALSIQKDGFLSQISHELRTPMTSIRSFSELLRDGSLEGPEASKFAGIIHGEAIRLTRLLDDLLDLSVLENGQVNLNLQDGSLRDLIDRALVAQGSDGGEIKVRRDPRTETFALHTDLDRLGQVFINLIANARKYCDAPEPELGITVARSGGVLRIDFIDNGSGIERSKQAVIFEKFSRLSDQAAAGGAGLGLAICREIMERLGGSVEYLPDHGGAAFRVSLPEAQTMIEE
jgi:Na+/proline symporter/signal transduction histidine kinase